MLGMGNTFNFDGEDNYRHVICLYSDFFGCMNWPTLLQSDMARVGHACNMLLWPVNASLNCYGSVMVTILSRSELQYFIVLGKN